MGVLDEIYDDGERYGDQPLHRGLMIVANRVAGHRISIADERCTCGVTNRSLPVLVEHAYDQALGVLVATGELHAHGVYVAAQMIGDYDLPERTTLGQLVDLVNTAASR